MSEGEGKWTPDFEGQPSTHEDDKNFVEENVKTRKVGDNSNDTERVIEENQEEVWVGEKKLADLLGCTVGMIYSLAEKYLIDHPEWRKEKNIGPGMSRSYHPDLIKLIKIELDRRQPAPDGWITRRKLYIMLGSSYDTVDSRLEKYKADHPDWFGEYKSETGNMRTYLSPDLVAAMVEEIGTGEVAPPGWVSKTGLSNVLKVDRTTLDNIADQYLNDHPDWVKDYKPDTHSKRSAHYHPTLVEIITKNINARLDAPNGWIPKDKFIRDLGVSKNTFLEKVAEYKFTNPEWFGVFKRPSNNLLSEYLHPDFVERVSKEVEERRPPKGWIYKDKIVELYGSTKYIVGRLLEKYRAEHPEWFGIFLDKRSEHEYYHPDLVAKVINDIESRETPPEGWMYARQIAGGNNVLDATIKKIAEPNRLEHPDWFKKFITKVGISEYYHPDLIEIINDSLEKRNRNHGRRELENRQKSEVDAFVSEIARGQSVDALKFNSLIGVLGGSKSLDILYRFRPEYRALPPEYVKGVLADYLGDFLVKPREFKLDDIAIAVEHLSDLSLREGLFEMLKEHCLRFYFQQRQKNPNRSSQDVIYDYLDEIVEKLHHLKSQELDDVIQEVIRYYDSVLKDFHKPEQFIGSLDPNREFPDINQRINMKELAEKQRLLIADEMGLGKSASVIMAKEQIGVRCALVVAPSNVISTWRRYLSDRNEDGGYFKLGEAPRVLEVSSPEALDGVASDQYDYVLISQERMNERYSEALASLDYDMLVVDEIHKLKSLEGRRTSELMDFSKKVEGEGKYLAMLSGTPAPNKVEDIAIALKLLYPEKFETWDDRDLVRQIIKGDLVDLRSLLLPRMQAKRLEEGVEMPALHEEKIETELSSMEMDIYEVLLEDDEMEAPQKMAMLRQFLLNPDLLDATPGIHSAKIEKVGSDLRECFTKNNKAVLFVNGYIEGVIRGKDNIIEKFGLPKGVEIRVIHGGNRNEREDIQKEFRETAGKILLVVSGQTADVGVDFTPAETVFTYNEPWTEYDRRQQVSRVYRPGLKHDLDVRTFVTKNTLEEGIHEYIGRKYQAIEKLLHGIPIQELEKQLLSEDEKSNNPDLEVNKELAEYYFSSWDKLMRIFAHVKEIGEEDFKEFLSEYGKDYADCYLDLGNRSYQANANRVAGTLVGSMLKERGGRPEETLVLDVASGPEMLRQHIGDTLQDRVISVDANQFHLKAKEGQNVQSAVASWRELPFREKSFDYLNLALALHYSSFVPSKGKFERLEVLKEANRVLKPGGRAVISLIYSLDLRDISKFHQFAEGLGFKVVDEYSGEVAEGDEYRSRVITLEKVADFDGAPESVLDKIDVKDYGGLKFKKTETRLKGQRNIIGQFGLQGRMFDVDFNAVDSAVRAEEQTTLAEGNALKEKYGGVINIPKSEIIDNKFVRIKVGEKYLLFKKLEKGSGVVIVK